MKIQIIVKLQIEGLHCWKECNLPVVDYLKHLHRHVFFVECKKAVDKTNREIEFIDFKKAVYGYLQSKFYDVRYHCCNFFSMSCEDIAIELLDKFQLDSCIVLEDNENGAEVIK